MARRRTANQACSIAHADRLGLAELPAVFQGRGIDITPALRNDFAAYAAGAGERFPSLLAAFAPVARSVAVTAKMRWAACHFEPIDDLVSDALIGVADALQKTNQSEVERFIAFAQPYARRAMRSAVLGRLTSGEHSRKAYHRLGKVRSTLTHELGRVPSEDETLAELRRQLDNPNFTFSPRPTFCSLASRLDGGDEMSEPTSPIDTLDVAISRDLIDFARRHLSSDDAQLFDAIRRGDDLKAIAARLDVSMKDARRRANALLLQLRQRRELQDDATPANVLPADLLYGNSRGDGKTLRHVRVHRTDDQVVALVNRGDTMRSIRNTTVSGRVQVARLIAAGRIAPNPNPRCRRRLDVPTTGLRHGRVKRTDAEIVALLRGGMLRSEVCRTTVGNNNALVARVGRMLALIEHEQTASVSLAATG